MTKMFTEDEMFCIQCVRIWEEAVKIIEQQIFYPEKIEAAENQSVNA